MCSMMEVSSVGVEEGDEEIELSLGLSIGGNFGKSTRLNPEEQKNTNADTDLSQEIQNQNSSGFSMAQTFVGDSEQESGAEHLDPQRKREIHALRRQEARKKREEKLRKRSVTVGSDVSDENMWLEAQRLQIRVKDRERRENEGKIEGGERKREKNEEVGHLNLALNHNGAQNPSHGSSATACGSSPLPIPVVPYPPLQLVPFANGFAYPCIMPCLAPAACNVGNEKNEKNVQRPLACRSFRPCQGSLNPLMGSDHSEYVSGKDGDAVSNGSPIYSSSLVSENRSSSQQGGSSSDTGSRSSHSKPNQSHLNFASEQSVSSTQMESAQAGDKLAKNTDNAVLPSIIQSNPTKLSNQTYSETHPDPDKNPVTSQIPNPGPLKTNEGLNTPSLSQMPCVSTTGNGPNGKTITGFLYRYTKAEVSIVCVCHGNSFSPAEFVEHAGGKDITHPLRHITVIPSAFG